MSIAGRSMMVRTAAVLSVALALVMVKVASAWGTEPWWHLYVGARPTLIPATAKNAEQEITSVPESAGFFLGKLMVEGRQVGCLANPAVVELGTVAEEVCGSPEVDESAAQLQATLQEQFGASVTVAGKSGGPGMVGEGEPLIVTGHERGLAPLRVDTEFESLGILGETETNVLSEGGSGRIVLQAVNLGDEPIDGEVEPVVLTDKLPPGLVAGGLAGATGKNFFPEQGRAEALTCSVSTVSCTFKGKLPPYERLEIAVWVTRTGAAGREENQVEVNGGGAGPASTVAPVTLGEGPVPFGVESFELMPEEEGGAPATQAGSHPFQLTTMLRFNETGEIPFQPAEPRNVSVELPTGLVGNAVATPKCSYATFSREENSRNECPADAAVGVASIGTVALPPPKSSFFAGIVPVFNLTPAPGEPARFGFIAVNVPVVFDTHLRAGGDYGVTVTVQNLTESAASLSSIVTLWGVPGDPAHDRSRGFDCVLNGEQEGCGPSLGSEKPFLTLPSACAPLRSSVVAQSWVPSAKPLLPVESSYKGGVDGCNREGFEPSLEVQSSTSSAFSPTELQVHLHVPQQTSEAPGGVSEADVRNTTVTLPPGLQINPAAAGRLQACSEAQIGYAGSVDPQTGELLFAEESQAERDGEAPHRYGCPDAAKIGTVRVKTPLLEEELTGAVYQAAQGANPFGSLLAVYVVAEAPKTGVRVRLAGKVQVEPDGQLVSTFDDTPQTPFEDFQLKFFGGGKAALATTGCGSYQTSSVFESWAGGAPVSPFTAPFSVSTSPGGGACASPGFAPAFLAGTSTNQAGGFSPFVTTLTRKDGEQTLSTASVTLPRGLLGMISKVTPCKEAQANVGACPAASKIGHVIAQAGVGNEPLVLPQPGRLEDPVYITGPYKGAPFGIAIVVPAEAGPFNLDENGHPVVVRGRIEVDPFTAQITIVTDPAPTRLQGIPLDVRAVEVVVDKPGFTFNPTSCAATKVLGTIGSSEGASEKVSTPFQAADCASLRFRPSFKVFTRARHSKRRGAYLQVVVRSGSGQANIGRVHVRLPKVLPSRLATLKLACSEAQFAKNPAGCPAASKVGFAKASTPVLPVPLTGPAIFVSHGGAAFPNLDVVLQGDHVTLDLVGNTSINKGVTTSTFAQVPDAPVNRFVLTLPEGPHSALSANGNLCKEKPRMPTVITGQNGAVIEQDTKIVVRGCKGGAHRRAHVRHRRHG